MWIPCLPGLRFWTSATTCTSSPIFVNVTVPVTWLPDFDSSCAEAFVTSCACAREPMAKKIAMQRIVFIPKTYVASSLYDTLNRLYVYRIQYTHIRAGL